MTKQRAGIARRPVLHGVKFFEDVKIGDEIVLGSTRVSRQDVEAFGRDFDPWCGAFAATPRASGWHIAALWMQSLVRYYSREAAELSANGRLVPELGPSPGVRHLAWHRPVCPGDTLTFATWAERKLELPARFGWGLLIGGAQATNQRGEIVISFLAELLLERRDRALRHIG